MVGSASYWKHEISNRSKKAQVELSKNIIEIGKNKLK